MTWIKFTRDYRYSSTRYTEYFKEGEARNLPRHVAESIISNGGAKKGGRPNAKQRADETNVSEAG